MEPRLLRFARNDVDGSVDRRHCEERATRRSNLCHPGGRRGLARNEPKKSFWRNEPEISNSFNAFRGNEPKASERSSIRCITKP